MALTITKDHYGVSGDIRRHIATIDFDSSYPSGGEALTPADLALREIKTLIVESKDGYQFEYDYANEKVKAFEAGADGGALDEVADSTDLSSVTGVHVVALGR